MKPGGARDGEAGPHGPEELSRLAGEISACRLCAARFAETKTAHSPRPVFWVNTTAPVMICGQAPGMRVHQSGRPFDDPSGDRLRAWMGIDRDMFYDRDRVAVLPMAFCFPGYDAKGSDLPPPKLCAETWHTRVLAARPRPRLMLLVGGYAFRWHLGTRAPVTKVVSDWRSLPKGVIPLPHPSWRNTGWLRRNPWFEADLVPVLRDRVREALDG